MRTIFAARDGAQGTSPLYIRVRHRMLPFIPDPLDLATGHLLAKRFRKREGRGSPLCGRLGLRRLLVAVYSRRFSRKFRNRLRGSRELHQERINYLVIRRCADRPIRACRGAVGGQCEDGRRLS